MGRADNLIKEIRSRGRDIALVSNGIAYAFDDLHREIEKRYETIESREIRSGQVVGLIADYSLACIGLFLALLKNRNIVALIPPSAKNAESYLKDSECDSVFEVNESGDFYWTKIRRDPQHDLLRLLKQRGEAGFIIFSSGSTGKPKAILHSAERFLRKFDEANKKLTTLTFLIFDHIAGLDTLFYGLCSGGALVFPKSRDTSYICELIQNHKVEVLPTSPSFLRLLCLSGAIDEFDLSSLKIITYGSEPMDIQTLERIHKLIPQARLIQKYGMSELGSPQSKSKDDGSLWLKLGGNEFQTRVIDDILWIRSPSAMLGYLNAPNPFDEEGWLCTGDMVERDGDWIRILGRKSEIIMVGGEKVYPQEVESVIMEIDGVSDALVKGDSHPMLGNIVTAQIDYDGKVSDKELLKIVRSHCRQRLEPYKVPIKVAQTHSPLFNTRQKKVRK